MTTNGADSIGAALRWLDERRLAYRFSSVRVPWDQMGDWHFQEDTGNLVHRSGRFFTVEGLRTRTDDGPRRGWEQPIIHQPEIGVLGFIVKEIDGVLHCLTQAKMEPGNVNVIQLSPTVQATRSNFTQAHRGARTRYLEYFVEPGLATVLVDVLQSEQGSWFYGKRNRNIIIEVTGDIPPHEDFRWLTIGEIQRLLRLDNVVNMDARSVLSCVGFAPPWTLGGLGGSGGLGGLDGFGAALRRSMVAGAGTGAVHSMRSVLSWFTARAFGNAMRTELIPLARVTGWHRDPAAISHVDGRHFAVIGVRVEAGSREVAGWTQPLLAPCGLGLAALLVKNIAGVLHVLMHARPEVGLLHGVELAPTVECVPDDCRTLPADQRPRFLDYVTGVPAERVRFDALQSEEGGRFHHAEGRYMIVEVEDDFPVAEPDGFLWVTVAQLTRLLEHSHYLNVQARSLVACLHSLW